MVKQFEHTGANAQNPELIISSSTTGMDLVLFYTRRPARSDQIGLTRADLYMLGYCSFTIGATLVMFWYAMASL